MKDTKFKSEYSTTFFSEIHFVRDQNLMASLKHNYLPNNKKSERAIIKILSTEQLGKKDSI